MVSLADQGGKSLVKDENLLMIFAKNPVLGKVKTRLAKELGDERALDIYEQMLNIAAAAAAAVDCRREVWYSDFIPEEDPVWDHCQPRLQHGADIGIRMQHAFAAAFQSGFRKAILIGTDIPGLSSEIISSAFNQLDHHDVVFGPANDGGYYLIGMKKIHPDLFIRKPWSTSDVLEKSLDDIRSQKDTYHLLPVLTDVDEISDLPAFLSTRFS